MGDRFGNKTIHWWCYSTWLLNSLLLFLKKREYVYAFVPTWSYQLIRCLHFELAQTFSIPTSKKKKNTLKFKAIENIFLTLSYNLSLCCLLLSSLFGSRFCYKSRKLITFEELDLFFSLYGIFKNIFALGTNFFFLKKHHFPFSPSKNTMHMLNTWATVVKN